MAATIKVIKKRSIHAQRRLDSGVHGAYFIYNKAKTRGIKLFHSSCSSKHQLFMSYEWERAKNEFNGLKRAHKAGLAPKPYKLAVVQSKGHFYAAVVMQHVKCLYRSDDSHYLDYDTRGILDRKLRKIGIEHNDLHSGNIVVCPRTKKALAIDFAMARITKRKRRA